MTDPYKFYSLCHSSNHETDLLIGAACEILQALQIISNQLKELYSIKSIVEDTQKKDAD